MAKETATMKALRLIRDNRIDSPTVFARHMWPDNPNWHHPTKAGRGTTRGGGMRLGAGGFLGRLRRAGLIYGNGTGYHPERFGLTSAGKALLKQFEDGT